MSKCLTHGTELNTGGKCHFCEMNRVGQERTEKACPSQLDRIEAMLKSIEAGEFRSEINRIEQKLDRLLMSDGAIAFNGDQLEEAAQDIGYPCKIMPFTSDDLDRMGKE